MLSFSFYWMISYSSVCYFYNKLGALKTHIYYMKCENGQTKGRRKIVYWSYFTISFENILKFPFSFCKPKSLKKFYNYYFGVQTERPQHKPI